MIPVYVPYLPDKFLSKAYDAIDSRWLSRGKYNKEAEDLLKEKLQVKHVILTCNGTAASHLLAKALLLKQKSPTVLVPDNVFVAAWNGFLYDNECNLVTCPSDLETWNVDESFYETSDGDAILIVPNLGNIINVPKLKEKYPDRLFLEDNCEGFLGKYSGQYTGTASLASAISFFGNKNITSGEGGALITNDDEVAEHVRLIVGQGQSDTKFVHTVMGHNYRMNNIQAALLCGQLPYLDEVKKLKEDVFETYFSFLKNVDGVRFQKQNPETNSATWMFGLFFEKNISYEISRSWFESKGVEVRPMFYPITSHKYLKSHPKVAINDPGVSCEINKKAVIFPSFAGLKKKEIKYICDSIIEYVKYID